MSLAGIAALIAALAFTVLVVFIILNLMKLSKIMEEAEETVKRINVSIDVVTRDVDNLSIEVEGLLNKVNTFADDLNYKLGETDPLFTAIGDLGITVSELNTSTRTMTNNLVHGVQRKASRNRGVQIFNHLLSRANNRRASEEEEKLDEIQKAEDDLRAFIKAEPSRTAGEIRIK